MAHALVNIGGRSYRLACNPGEEEHLAALGQFVDAKIDEMRGSFRDIDDQRIVVMAALGVADQLFEARRTAQVQTDETAAAQAREAATLARVAALEAAIAETSARVEALADSLEATAED